MVDYERFEERFGNDDTVVLGVEVEGGVLDEEAWERVAAIAREVSEIPGVATVEADTDHAPGAVLANGVPEVLVGTLVSADGTLALIVGSLEGEPDAKSVTQALEAIVARQDERTTVHLTGTPVITAAFETVAANDLGRLVPMAVAVMIHVLLLLLRSFVVAFAALVEIALGAISAMGVAGLIGAPINNLTLAVPQILVAIGTAGCVHLLSAYRDARRDGRDTAGAMRHSLTLNARPMLLASGTTAVGFFSLAISDLKPVATLGLVAGSGTLLIVAYTFLVTVPLVRHLSPYKRAPIMRQSSDPWTPFVGALVRWSPAIFIVAAVAALLGGRELTRVSIDSDPLRYFPPRMEVRHATERIEEKLGGMRGIEIVVEDAHLASTKEATAELRSWLLTDPRISRVIGSEHKGSPGGPRWLAKDGGTERLTVNWDRNTSQEVLTRSAEIDEQMAALGLHGFITGKTFLYQTVNEHIVRSFATSALLALVLIAMILTIALRSLRLGLLSLIPNAIPLIAGVVSIQLWGRTLDIGGTVVASVCLGIAVDDTIHIIAGYQFAREKGLEARDAMIHTLCHRGRALVTTTVVLVATFGVFALGDFVPNAMFGVLCAVVITAALIADLTLLPALLLATEPRGVAREVKLMTASEITVSTQRSEEGVSGVHP